MTGTRTNPSDVYTQEQLAALETLKHPDYALGIATSDNVNKVLHTDGTLSTDLRPIRKALADNAVDKRAAATEALPTDVDDAVQLLRFKTAQEENRRAQDAIEEFEEHVRQKRFLFIPAYNDSLTQFVYFQVAVEGNPDTPALIADLPEDHPDILALKAKKEAAALP